MTSNDSSADWLEPLRIALDLERKGREFFKKAAVTTKGELARRTFEFLAGEEEKHIKRITDFCRVIEESGPDSLPKIERSDADARLTGFHRTLTELGRSVNPTTSDLEAYQTALTFENGAEEFYTIKETESNNVRVKAIYRWLIQEEAMHSRLLESCLEFVADPRSWFEKNQ